MYNEPMAWWIVSILILAVGTIAGFLLKDSLKQMRDSNAAGFETLNKNVGGLEHKMEDINKQLQDINKFIAKQAEKNDGYRKELDDIWEDVDKQWTEINNLKTALMTVKGKSND